MIDLYIVPVRQYAKGLSITLYPSNDSSSLLIKQSVGSKTNLEEVAHKLVERYYEKENYHLEFHKLFQPNVVSENLAVVYRVIHVSDNHCGLSKSATTEIEVEITSKSEDVINIRGFHESESDTTIVESVISEMHQQMKENIDAKSNKRGFKTMLSLLPNIFDSRELGMAYYSLTGKQSSVKMLSNSLLDHYIIGSAKGTSGARKINGRNLIESYEPIDTTEAETVLDEKYENYRTSIKAGPKAKTLFRKK